jgi:ATP-binding cassette, subfamily F, member 3
VVAPVAKPRESAKAAADRKRREAEERNARHRRTRDLVHDLAAARAEAESVERELAELTERLADPGIYTDAALVRQLVDRHNTLRDRSAPVAAEVERLAAELAEAEAGTDPAMATR